jgi:nucleoid-associated protein YgaU
MAFDLFDRLGRMFGKKVAEQVLHRPDPETPAAEAPPAEAPPAEAAATAPAAEATPAAPEVTYTVEEAPAAPAAAESTAYATTTDTAGPTAEPATAPMTAEAAPTKSAEELEEERLWAETDAAWAAGDFQKVTESLDALRALQPEDAAVIDEKIAAAQYNQASALEQSGELDRALYLYQEAQRRNPNLGEAGFAIERVQAALRPSAPVAVDEPAAPAEQTYTVESGDSLWAVAQRFYGDGNQWSRIYEANRDQLDNPDVIQPGQVLRIPS